MANTRAITASDLPFMVHMLRLVAGAPDAPVPLEVCREDPRWAHHINHWDDPGVGQICLVSGRPVGAGWLTRPTPQQPAHIASGIPQLVLAVLPDAQGQGHGSYLLTRVLMAAESSGWPKVCAAVHQNDERSLHLLSGAGFTTVAERDGLAVMLRVAS